MHFRCTKILLQRLMIIVSYKVDSDKTLKIFHLWLSKAYLNYRVQTTFLLIKGHFLNLSRYFNLIKSVNFVLLKNVCLNGRHEDCTDE